MQVSLPAAVCFIYGREDNAAEMYNTPLCRSLPTGYTRLQLFYFPINNPTAALGRVKVSFREAAVLTRLNL